MCVQKTFKSTMGDLSVLFFCGNPYHNIFKRNRAGMAIHAEFAHLKLSPTLTGVYVFAEESHAIFLLHKKKLILN